MMLASLVGPCTSSRLLPGQPSWKIHSSILSAQFFTHPRRTSKSKFVTYICGCFLCSFRSAWESHQTEIPNSTPCCGTPRCTDPGPRDHRSHRPPCWGPARAALSRLSHPTKIVFEWTCCGKYELFHMWQGKPCSFIS